MSTDEIVQTWQSPEVRQWVLDAKKAIEKWDASGRTTDFTCTLVQTLIGTGLDEEEVDWAADNLDPWAWLSRPENLHMYQRVIWEMVMSRHGLMQKVRRVLLRDLKVEGVEFDSGFDSRYGRIVLKEWGQAILDHFLTRKPNPEWVGQIE